jgi:hypothetical protein
LGDHRGFMSDGGCPRCKECRAAHLGGNQARVAKLPGRAAAAVRLSAVARADRIALAMWLKRLFGRGENVSPSGHAPSRKETEQDREDRLEDFMDEQVRQRDEDESRMQDEGGS